MASRHRRCNFFGSRRRGLSLLPLASRFAVLALRKRLDRFRHSFLGCFCGLLGRIHGFTYLRPRSMYRYVGLTVLSLAGAAFCWLFYMFFAANTYGT